jgi:FkbM family methyltransferase
MLPTTINERWELLLPAHRNARMEWPVWEKERLASMHDLLRVGDTIFDIGAEEGDFPGLWSSWGCEVVCFEPNPRVWPNIRAIWEANRFSPLFGWFVGFASDVTDLDPPASDVDQTEQDGWPICAYGEVIGDHGFRHLAQEAASTPQITIDDFCSQRGLFPDAITMDVEGSELRVLHGAVETLRARRTKVWVSIHTDLVWMDEIYGGVGRDDVIVFMDGLGYSAEHLATDHEEHWVFLP